MFRANTGPYRTPTLVEGTTAAVEWPVAEWIVLIVVWAGAVARLDAAIRCGEVWRAEDTLAAAAVLLGPVLAWLDRRKRRPE
jgi:hypothetical protein